MKTVPIGLCLLAFFVVMVSCEAPQPAVRVLSEADLVALRDVTEQYREAEVVNDWAAVTRLYTESAIRMLPKGPTIHGREAILQEFESRPSRMIEYDQRIEEIKGLGDLALVRGVFSYVVEVKGDTLRGSGKYLAVYQRQADGGWLIDTDIFNFDEPS
jgi:ketosteroid isomerase-like protein